MQRKRPLTSYSSSSSESSSPEPEATPIVSTSKSTSPQPKKRKLPPLSSQLTIPIPVDDLSKHQGRTRTVPHIDGQWAAYVYVPIKAGARDKIGRFVRRTLASARERESMGCLRSIGFDIDSDESGKGKTRNDDGIRTGDEELHISLSRPVFLRAHQREEFKRAVRIIAKSNKLSVFFVSFYSGTYCLTFLLQLRVSGIVSRTRELMSSGLFLHRFTGSFATIAALTNDEKTRSFLCLEVGAGHNELRKLSDDLTPTLRSIRQKEYYAYPRFHASFAWALLDNASASTPLDISKTSALSRGVDRALSDPPCESSSHVTSLDSPDSFPTIPSLPDNLVPSLNDEFGKALLTTVGHFEVKELKVRIGKDIFGWRLEG